MLIAGLQKFTTLDYPGKIAAAVFTLGCNFRCPFCHNPELLSGKKGGITPGAVLFFLEERQEQLQGVCISGGEPTLQSDLLDFIRKIKRLGYAVKLDTNGARPEVVAALLEAQAVDYFAIDVKTDFKRYGQVSPIPEVGERVKTSIKAIHRAGVPLELRTTMAPGVVREQDFDAIIADLGEELLASLVRFNLQQFRPQKCLHKAFEGLEPYPPEYLDRVGEKLRKSGAKVTFAY